MSWRGLPATGEGNKKAGGEDHRLPPLQDNMSKS
jgi:hypothetical protein